MKHFLVAWRYGVGRALTHVALGLSSVVRSALPVQALRRQGDRMKLLLLPAPLLVTAAWASDVAPIPFVNFGQSQACQANPAACAPRVNVYPSAAVATFTGKTFDIKTSEGDTARLCEYRSPSGIGLYLVTTAGCPAQVQL